jgi:hypothetical protein
MKPNIKVSNDKLMGVSKVAITFVSNFHEKAHSGRTTLILKEKKRTQSNKEATFSGQSTWISWKRDHLTRSKQTSIRKS